MKHTITLTLGDWSRDGHNISDTVCIESNIDAKELQKAYRAGVEKTNVDLTKDIARDYEDGILPEDAFQKLATFGLKDIFDKGIDDKKQLWTDSFAEVWLFIAKQGNAEFAYSLVNRHTSDIKIGGYGLYQS